MYTKQQLREMGFSFDLNGNILSPRDLENSAANYIIEKSCRWLENNMHDEEDGYGGVFAAGSRNITLKEFIESYKEDMKSQGLCGKH